MPGHTISDPDHTVFDEMDGKPHHEMDGKPRHEKDDAPS